MAASIVPVNGHAALITAEEGKSLITPGSLDPKAQGTPHCTEPRSHGPRNLAIISIFCGLSCVGIPALVYAMKAEGAADTGAADTEAAKTLRHRSRRLSLLSIGLWVAVLVFVPLFLGLLSYIIARAE